MITVCKLDHAGRETFRYTGTITAQGPGWVTLEAIFGIPDMDRGYVVFRTGDRFVEWYDSARWYNIFEIHDVTDDHLKGWYCNITRPVIITAERIAWPDLALDVWISPQGQIRLEDEDEFAALPIDAETRAKALRAVDELRERVKRGQAPFDRITDSPGDSPR
jgi:predicted RNA-binding protein associated with RNAse of E/G family